MNSKDYWQGRYLQLKAVSERSSAEYERQLATQMRDINDYIGSIIEKWYKRYARTAHIDAETAASVLRNAHGQTWEMTLDEFIRKAKLGGYDDELDLIYIKQQVARLQELQAQILSTLTPALPGITDSMRSALQNQYQRTYSQAMYLNEAVSGVITNWGNFDETAAKMALAKPWQGSDFSQRLWGNVQKQLPEMLMKSVLHGVILGENPRKVAKAVANANRQFAEQDLHRLIQTEMAHITEEATYQSYDDSGVEWYEYMATLESRTCETCGHLDMRHFRLSDRVPGGNYPPIHPYCRCTTAAWDSDYPPIGKRWSRDPETGKRQLVDGMSYKEWARQHEASLHRTLAEERRESEAEQKAKIMSEAKQHADTIRVENHAQRMKPKLGKQYEWNEINPEQYNKHVKGSPEYANYAKAKKRPPSEVTLSPSEVDSIIAKYGRTGQQDTRNQIRFTHDQPIGYFVDIDGNRWPTYQGRISYRKGKGSHITPSRPDYLP
ncbi:minor capsid protein [Lacticaseibacillus hulanensis]|uniref:minor capsid protein n=1 Tax=Lacticaseibacillus hulanensis TaxID=2493111 RepID=UPI000FDB1852|nr:minor capsid protein [Lacticaseibacillus hulanensis]